MIKKLLLLGTGAATAGVLSFQGIPWAFETWKRNRDYQPPSKSDPQLLALMDAPLKSRLEQINDLKTKEFDLLVIGGGATGCGVALDSVSRGLSTALVEKFDFASGTSSRSTKLIHGGVRYLQKAVFNLDKEQFYMVKEALSERANLLEIAPHLSKPLPIMLPIYKTWQLPYYWAGIKMYDIVSGPQILQASFYLTKSRALELFPMLKKDKLKGALVYYDGQHEDARMCLAIGLTAAKLGASVSNYMEVTEIVKTPDASGKSVASGVRVLDRVSGESFTIKAKSVINATGPYSDQIRQKDVPEGRAIVQPSSGIHIVLPAYYSPENMGLLDPATSDGRVIFFLPWQNSTIAGTTDRKCEVTDNPNPTEADIKFILNEIKHYLSPEIMVRRGDVLSAWAGIRPLVLDPAKGADTQAVARNHIIEVSKSNIITIAGGKWTTYREMAEETVDRAISVCDLKPKCGCKTKGLLLEGGYRWTPLHFLQLVQDFGVEPHVANHLSHVYGDKAFRVLKLDGLSGKRWPVIGNRLHPDYPYLESEVRWACREYACRAVDVLARRTRLAYVNVHAAVEVLPRVVDIMAEELKWSPEKKKAELEHCTGFLRKEMGLDLKREDRKNQIVSLTSDEIKRFSSKFKEIDIANKGFITITDLRQYFKGYLERHGRAGTFDDSYVREILDEVDLNKNGQVEIGEFLQFMSAMKTGSVGSNRLQHVLDTRGSGDQVSGVDRSGGGV